MVQKKPSPSQCVDKMPSTRSGQTPGERRLVFALKLAFIMHGYAFWEIHQNISQLSNHRIQVFTTVLY
jgi:hypothetical protein